MSNPAGRISSLSPQKLALLSKKLKEKSGTGKEQQQVIPRRSESATSPLSYAQQRLWFIDQLEPDSSAYNIPFAVRLTGHLRLDILSRTLGEIVRRHEALRTSFPSLDGRPVQLVAPAQPVALPLIDLSSLPSDKRQTEAQQLASLEARQTFDLGAGSLLRVKVVRIDEQDHVVLLTMQHIISDGWSMGILVKEVAELYEAYSQGKESVLPELPIQYADFATWQREWLQGEVLEEQLGYWKEQLSGAPPVLELPTDYPRPAVRSYRGAQQSIQLPRTLGESLKALAQREDVSLFMLLLAAFKVLLHRYSGQEDVVVGTPIANRNHMETERLIGFFVNTLVLRTQVERGVKFSELLKRVREVTLGAYAHQDVPFEMLVEALQPERSLSHHPLFQVVFVLQNAPQERLELTGVELRSMRSEQEAAKFDLTLTVSEAEGDLRATFDYSADLFAAETVERMTRHLGRILEEVVREGAGTVARGINEIEMLTESERRQLLEEWNPTVIRSEWQQCVHELFEAQVERTPQQVALVCEDYQLSYEELNSKANQLAHHLISLGIAPEQVVGLCLERSPEMVIALLAVLKAGAVYLPLDPHYPDRRLAQMAANSQLTLLITQQHLSSRLVALVPSGTQRLDIDAELQLISTGLVSNPQRRAYPGNLAYLIYTSGSTGEAKGVMVEHRGLCNLVEAQARAFEVDEESRVLQFASLSFDASVSEVLVTLCSGGRLCMAGAQVVLAGGALEEVLRAQEVTVATLPPTLLRSINREALAGVRTLVSAGEACTAEIVERCGDGRRLLNAYGPTETSVCASISEALKSGERSRAVVPIGRAISNTQMYVLDERMELLPVGVAGELYIGGVGVARGYAGKAEQTAEKFVPHPFSSEPGARLYRTGDRGRVRGDGQVEYLGRLDTQVKVRGYRIELGEIEAALLEHAEVREAVVVVREEGGEKRLVGYVVREEGGVASGSELRQHVKERLPEYMIPQWVVMMDEMPLTANGKIDRKRLPEPGLAGSGRMESEYEEARNSVEEALINIWEEVLKVERVGIRDNFFELGGDSIRSIQIVAKARQAGFNLTARQMFQHQTIAALATLVAESPLTQEREDAGGGTNYFLPVGVSRERLKKLLGDESEIEDVYPLSPMQKGMLFQSLYEPDFSSYFSQTLTTLPGEFDADALQAALRQVVERHPVLRTSFIWEGLPEPLQVVRKQVELPWAQFDWRDMPESVQHERFEAFLQEDRKRGVRLSEAPLMRFTLFHLADGTLQFVWSTHHILLDGWSQPLLLNEIMAFYRASRLNETLTLEQPRPFREYIHWLRGQDERKAEEFWRERMKGFTEPLSLGADWQPERATTATAGFETKDLNLPETTSNALQEFAQKHQLTLNTVVQGAWALLLSHYSGGRDDVVFGATVAGRPAELPGVESMIGLFINTLPVRAVVKENDSLAAWLKQIQDEQAEMREYEHISLIQVQGWSEVPRGRNLFESNVVFFNLPKDAMEQVNSPNAPAERAVASVSRSANPTNYPLTLKAAPGRRLYLQLLYDARQFEAPSIERRLRHLSLLLEDIAAGRSSTPGELREILIVKEKSEVQMEKSKRKEAGFNRFRSTKPKAIEMSRQAIVKTAYLPESARLPLVITPNVENVDLLAWAQGNQEFIQTELLAHRALLFRGFDIDSVAQFERFAQSFSGELLAYTDQHTPRTKIVNHIYTSTEYPNDHYVPFHSENSKNHSWPMKIWFFCMQPAAQGGETPIADNRQVFSLIDPAIRARFIERQVMYVRNFGAELGLPWQTVFQTDDPAEVERLCRQSRMEFQWRTDGRLRVRHVCPAVATHPLTGEMVWFNQAHLFHVSSIEPKARETLLAMYGEEELPGNAYYGDGSPIETSVLDEIREAYKQVAVSFPWQARDVLMLDNMTVAHGRAPFSGTRQILVAMAEPHGHQINS